MEGNSRGDTARQQKGHSYNEARKMTEQAAGSSGESDEGEGAMGKLTRSYIIVASKKMRKIIGARKRENPRRSGEEGREEGKDRKACQSELTSRADQD
jgi:hypothetical protein